MSDPIPLNYNTDQSGPIPFPVPTEAQLKSLGPFPAASCSDMVAVLNHLLEISMSAGEPIEAPAESAGKRGKSR